MAVNVSVVKHGTENSMGLIRRFTKRMQGAGIVRKIKGIRYYLRTQSKGKRKMSALVRVEKHAKKIEMEKLGLLEARPERPRR